MTPEGLGGLKWSIMGEVAPGQPEKFHVMQGVTRIATVADHKTARLIAGAPQLWAAANDLVKGGVECGCATALTALGGQVARCVGKAAWTDVQQA